jgi:hypothetical protein
MTEQTNDLPQGEGTVESRTVVITTDEVSLANFCRAIASADDYADHAKITTDFVDVFDGLTEEPLDDELADGDEVRFKIRIDGEESEHVLTFEQEE